MLLDVLFIKDDVLFHLEPPVFSPSPRVWQYVCPWQIMIIVCSSCVHFVKTVSILYFLREEVIWVWFDIGMNKWWQNLKLVLANIHFNSVAGKKTFYRNTVLWITFLFSPLLWFLCFIMDNKTLFSWKSWQMCWWDVWSWLSHVKLHHDLIKESSSNDFSFERKLLER